MQFSSVLTSALGRPVDKEIRTRAQRGEGSRRWGAQTSQRVSPILQIQWGCWKIQVNHKTKNNCKALKCRSQPEMAYVAFRQNLVEFLVQLEWHFADNKINDEFYPKRKYTNGRFFCFFASILRQYKNLRIHYCAHHRTQSFSIHDQLGMRGTIGQN